MLRALAPPALAALLVAASATPALGLTGPTGPVVLGEAARGETAHALVTLTTGRDAASPGEPVTGPAQITGNPAFVVADDRCDRRAVTSACTVRVAFTPSAAGPAEAVLSVAGADGTASVRLEAAGYVTGARLAPSVPLLDFGAHGVGTLTRETVAIENTGDRTVEVRRSAIEGPGAEQYLVGRDACAGARLQPGDRCNVRLAFAPDDASGGGAARLVVDTEPRSTTTVELTGATALPLTAPRSVPIVGGPRPEMVQAAALTLPPATCGVVGVRSASAAGRSIRLRVGANCPARFSIIVSRKGRVRAYTRRLKSRGTKTFRLTTRFGTGEYRVLVRTVVRGQLIAVRRAVKIR